MAEIEDRLAEAETALATLDEAVGKSPRTTMERDSAILRLIYTFEAAWLTMLKQRVAAVE